MNNKDDDIIAVENIRKSGQDHWLIIPKVGSTRHIRDCEALTVEDLPLRKYIFCHSHSAPSYTLYQVGRKVTDLIISSLDAVVEALDAVKENLLCKHFPNIQRSAVLAGFHRGRRHFHGPVIFPDIVSIHHLHLHIIIKPFTAMALFKYPSWFRFMWISDQNVMEQVKGRKRIKSKSGSRPSETGCSADEAGA